MFRHVLRQIEARPPGTLKRFERLYRLIIEHANVRHAVNAVVRNVIVLVVVADKVVLPFLGAKTEVSHGEGAGSGAPSNWATP